MSAVDGGVSHAPGTVVLVAALLILGTGASTSLAQVPDAAATRAAGISGIVMDAASRDPVPGVSVTLEGRAGSAFARATGFLGSTLSTITDNAGEYRFPDIPAGDYRLHVQRVGYESATADVTFRSAANTRVSFGLRVAPVLLERLDITSASATPVLPNATNLDAAALDRQRVAAEQLRQLTYLPGDVRVVTRADVSDGITLGETDLFRAMQRLPGVTSGDEYSAELWTRGARWDQTRVYFDGLPLFNPLHAAGVFTSVNADALGAALLHPGVQPTHLGGGAAAVELTSRRTPLHPEHNTAGELSVVSARLTHDMRSGSGRSSALVSLRRSYLDWLTAAIERIGGGDDIHIPYHFYDAIGRVYHQLGRTRSIEVSSFLSLDRVHGDVPDVLNSNEAEWGGNVVRATLSTPLLGLHTRHTIGASTYRSTIWQKAASGNPDLNAPSMPPAANDLLYVTLLGSAHDEAAADWSAGYEAVVQRGRYNGARPGTHVETALPERVAVRETSAHGALWADRRWRPGERLTVQTGVRAEVARGTDLPHLAPRLAARWQHDGRLSFSAAAGRTYQYTQTIGAAGVRPTQGMHADYVWLPAGGEVPVLRTDVVTVSMERWLGHAWLAGVTLHARVAGGVAVTDPTPGTALERPLFVTGRNTARGFDISARKLTGRVTGAVAYTWGISEMEAVGLRFPAPSDRRHVLDATAQLRLSRSWLIGAAYTAASGTPYTQTFPGSATCSDARGSCTWIEEPWVGEPGDLRARGSHSLDLLTEWSKQLRTWQGSVFLQVRNALNGSNEGRYIGTQPPECDGCDAIDEFLPGAPVLPVIGLRFAF